MNKMQIYAQYQKETTEISWPHNEVERHGELNPHRAYRMQEG